MIGKTSLLMLEDGVADIGPLVCTKVLMALRFALYRFRRANSNNEPNANNANNATTLTLDELVRN